MYEEILYLNTKFEVFLFHSRFFLKNKIEC
jgi:hypothetical protein